MSIAVEGLEIEVKNKADSTVKSLQGLIAKMTSLKAECQRTIPQLSMFAKELSKISDIASVANSNFSNLAPNVGKVAKNARKISEEFSRAKKNVEETGLAINSFTQWQYGNNNTGLATTNQSTQYREPLRQATAMLPDFSVVDAEWREIDDTTRNVNDTISEIEENTKKIDFDKVNADIKKAKKELEKTKGIISEISKKFKSLFTSVGRIAFYRLARTFLKEISDSISEGLKNVYAFSTLMGGEYAKTMDGLTSTNNQFKNQIGSAFSELWIMAEPYLDSLLQKAIGVANTISQIFAYLNGDKQYKKANYVAATWQDATDAVKAYKSQVLGIDELNILSEQSGSSGSASGTNTADLYTYEKVPNAIGEKVEKIKDTLSTIWEIIKDIAIVIGAIKLSKDLVSLGSFIKDAGGLKAIAKALASKLKVVGGLTISIVGVAFEFKGAYDWAKNGASLKNVLETVLGAGGLIGGGLLAFGATSLYFTIPLAITIPIIAITIADNKTAKENYLNSEFAQWVDEINAKITEIQGNIDGIKISIETRKESVDTTIQDCLNVKTALDRIFELSEKESPTKKELSEIKGLVDNINAMNIDGIQLELDAEGRIASTREQLDLALQDLLAFKLTELATDNMVASLLDLESATKNQSDALSYLETLQEEYGFALEEQQSAYEKYNAYVEKFSGTFAMLLPEVRNAKIAYKESTEKVKDLENAVANATQAHDDATQAVRECQKEYDFYTDIISNAQAVAEKHLNPTLGDTTTKVQEQTSALSNLISKYEELSRATSNAGGFSTVNSNVLPVPTKAKGGIIQKYANGGTPAHGQLFIANEGASPEMIGSWGSQSAVANTDQIVNGIQSGVSSAVSAVLAPYLAQIATNTRETANKNFSVNIGDRDIAKANNRGQKLLGRTLITT